MLIGIAVLGSAGYWGWGRYYGPGSSASPAASATAGAAPAASAAPGLSGTYAARIGDQDVEFLFDQQPPLKLAFGYGSYVNRVTNRKCATQIISATIQPSDLPAGAVAFDQSPREGYTACSARIPLSIVPDAPGTISVKWYKPGTSEVLMSGILELRKEP